MAATTYVLGSDGFVSVAGTDQIKVKSYAASLFRQSFDVTAFGDAGRRKRLGFLDLTGSLSGIMIVGTTTSTVTTDLFYGVKTNYSTGTNFSESVSLTLGLYGTSAAATSGAMIVAGVVFDSFAFSSDKGGDASVTANFANGGGTAPVLTWLT
jgi:hypothetical protein